MIKVVPTAIEDVIKQFDQARLAVGISRFLFHCFNSSARSCFYRDFLMAEREGFEPSMGF
jgi:hypothetical protein